MYVSYIKNLNQRDPISQKVQLKSLHSIQEVQTQTVKCSARQDGFLFNPLVVRPQASPPEGEAV